MAIGVNFIWGGAYSPPTGPVATYSFTSAPTGNITLPSGLTYACATASRSAQTSASTVLSGIAAGQAVVGGNGTAKGLLLERGATNIITSDSRDAGALPDGPLGGSASYTASGTVGPDGAGAPKLGHANSGVIGKYKGYTAPSPGWQSGSVWYKAPNGSSRISGVLGGSGVAAALTPNYGTAAPQTWFRSAKSANNPGTAAALESLDGRDLGAYGGPTPAGSVDAIIDFLMYEAGAIPSEWHQGTRAGASLSATAAQIVSAGMVSMHVKFYPKGGSTSSASDYQQNVWLWYSDANNNAYVDMTTNFNRVYVKIAGTTAYFATRIPTISAGGLVSLFVAAGGNRTPVGTVRIGGVTTDLGAMTTLAGLVPSTGTLGILSNPADVTTGIYSSWIDSITFYAAGSAPASL